MSDNKTYTYSFTLSPSGLLDNFEDYEQDEILDHFGTAEAFCDYIAEDVATYNEQDGLTWQLDNNVFDIHDRIDWAHKKNREMEW